MTKTLKTMMALMALTSLTACDYAEKRELQKERASATYQAAMADYKAGRIDQAIAGFRKACAADPGNSLSRFQLACLLQDTARDYLDAFCSYREFLAQHPDSDKANLAKDRMAICEREVAKRLAEKHGLTSNTLMTMENEKILKRLKDAETRNAKLSDDVAVTMQRVAHLLAENAKLKAAIKGEADSGSALAAAGVKDARALLDEDDDDRMRLPAEVAELRKETEPEETDRIKVSSDVAALRREGEEDEKLAGSSLLPTHPAGMSPVSLKREDAKRPVKEPPHEQRPDVYVVQEGDSLYRIAMRFYGRSTAWKLIRDANKAVISVDGRVNSGMKIRLPNPR